VQFFASGRPTRLRPDHPSHRDHRRHSPGLVARLSEVLAIRRQHRDGLNRAMPGASGPATCRASPSGCRPTRPTPASPPIANTAAQLSLACGGRRRSALVEGSGSLPHRCAPRRDQSGVGDLRRHPGESRDPSFHRRDAAKWIPAFAPDDVRGSAGWRWPDRLGFRAAPETRSPRRRFRPSRRVRRLPRLTSASHREAIASRWLVDPGRSGGGDHRLLDETRDHLLSLLLVPASLARFGDLPRDMLPAAYCIGRRRRRPPAAPFP